MSLDDRRSRCPLPVSTPTARAIPSPEATRHRHWSLEPRTGERHPAQLRRRQSPPLLVRFQRQRRSALKWAEPRLDVQSGTVLEFRPCKGHVKAFQRGGIYNKRAERNSRPPGDHIRAEYVAASDIAAVCDTHEHKPVIHSTTMSRPSFFANCLFRILNYLPDGLLLAPAYLAAWFVSK